MGWVVHHDNSDWEAGTDTAWNVGGWWDVSGVMGANITELGTWVEGYEPLKCRVTFTGGGTAWFYVQDATPSNIGTGSGTSPCSITLDFTGLDDIAKLQFDALDGEDITNIEFLSPWAQASFAGVAVANISKVATISKSSIISIGGVE